MKIYFKIFCAALSLMLILSDNVMTLSAQSKKRKSTKAKTVLVASRIVDESGEPVYNAEIIAGEGAEIQFSDKNGDFSVKSSSDGIIQIEAEKFRTVVLNLKVAKVPDEIVLIHEGFLSGKGDFIRRADGSDVTTLENSQAVSVIDPANIAKYPDLNISNAFQGQAAGLIVRGNTGGLGNNGSSFYVRGLHSSGTAAIVVIDGIERAVDDISAEEIGSIQVLKDAPAKALYGPRAANGVILITTKRGEANKNIVNITAEYGLSPNTRVPKYLGSYDYATLYNEARVNDGLTPYYSSEQLDGYLRSSGENDNNYPNVDWYSKFAGSVQTYRKASADFSGGNETVQYALVTNYTGGSGIESVGDRTQLNRINLRGNLDIRINDFITAVADVAARIKVKSSSVGESDMFSRISVMRPNEYPLTLSAETLGLEQNSNIPYFGGSLKWKSNLLDDMEYGGYTKTRNIISQTDLGLKMNLGRFVNGLSAEAFMTFDNSNSLGKSLTKNHPAYAIDSYLDENGNEAYRITQVRKLNENDNIAIKSHSTSRRMGIRGMVGYDRTIGLHKLSSNLSFRYYTNKDYSSQQDCMTTNATARFNWSYNSKIFTEVVFGLMGSNQFNIDNRYLFAPAASIGWVVCDKPFVKIKASGGKIGYDPDSDYLLYKTTWIYPGNYPLGETGSGIAYRTALSNYGNPDIGWITSKELNAGVEFRSRDGKFSTEANYFRESREGGISALNSVYSSIIGDYIIKANCTDVRNQGVDFSAFWNDSAQNGDFKYTAGLTLTWSKNKIIHTDEVNNIEKYRSVIGSSTSSWYGLMSEGLFGKDVSLKDHSKQNYGDYTIGDVAYKDINQDGLVDGRDEARLGQRFPVSAWGFNLNLRYKGIGLYLLATAETGASIMLNNSYWWNTGTDSYSVKALDRYHPENNPDGSLPRLTSTSGSNSYQNSDFWLEKADWFRLKNAELSYTFNCLNHSSVFRQAKIFIRGTNLFVLSKFKDLDPEVPDAGVSNCPVYRTITGGITITL